jgi:hypothetical protein
MENNQEKIAAKIAKEFNVKTWYDDGNVGVTDKVSAKLFLKIQNKYGNTKVGDGGQEGDIIVNGTSIQSGEVFVY